MSFRSLGSCLCPATPGVDSQWCTSLLRERRGRRPKLPHEPAAVCTLRPRIDAKSTSRTSATLISCGSYSVRSAGPSPTRPGPPSSPASSPSTETHISVIAPEGSTRTRGRSPRRPVKLPGWVDVSFSSQAIAPERHPVAIGSLRPSPADGYPHKDPPVAGISSTMSQPPRCREVVVLPALH